ncbi:ribosylnicotinamide kinase [Mycoemilia scoparia]|uniref:Ribosylnicotinamide kinase n=1 Tax=Mycoemilia scoparia TaxID=417184 RepID=A0A9W8DQL3_9FUNG|nr:ribosylnicotinamide kinase [Mycoemilia scoparia]
METGLEDWDCPDAFDMTKFVKDIQKAKINLEKLSILQRSSASSDKQLEIQEIKDHYASRWANPSEDVNKVISDKDLKILKERIEKSISSTEGASKETTSGNASPFNNVKLVLVDGILLFNDRNIVEQGAEKHLLPGDVCDVKIFFTANPRILRTRREARSAYATKEGIWVDPPGYFDNLVWPNFLKFHYALIKKYPEASGEPIESYNDNDYKKSGHANLSLADYQKNLTILSTTSTMPSESLARCVDTILESLK